MNIRNRLKKIESEMIPAEPPFCGCYQKHLQEMVELVYHGVAVKSEPPDLEKSICDRCRKPFAERDIKLNQNILRCYGGEATMREN